MTFNNKNFRDILLKAKGNRSINKYALDCGVSAAHISRLLRGLLDTPPTPDILRKLANSAQNNVTYENLMEVAGHIGNNPKLEYGTCGAEDITFIKKENQELKSLLLDLYKDYNKKVKQIEKILNIV